jgi:hypothetical protein
MRTQGVTIIAEKSSTGFSAYSKDDRYPIATYGDTLDEVRENALEGLNLAQEVKGEALFILEDIQVELDIKQFFEFYGLLNINGLAHRIGINRTLLNQYATGQKRPSEKQVEKIVEGIRSLGRELAGLELTA